MYFDWTEEKLDLLRERWKEGVSAPAIAREIGATRNAVLGKVFRLRQAGENMSSRATPANPHRKRKAAKYRGIAKAVKKYRSQTPYLSLVSVPAGPGVPFLERRSFECAYITEGEGVESICCGSPVAPHSPSYCDGHHAATHRPSKHGTPGQRKAGLVATYGPRHMVAVMDQKAT